MLILRRKVDDVTVVDGKTRIVVISIRGNTVTLGFDAPKEVDIQREERLKDGRPPTR